MIRRSPTRIALRLDDLQEYEAIRTEQEAKKESERRGSFNAPTWNQKLPQSVIQERIGYVPQVQVPSHSRPNI